MGSTRLPGKVLKPVGRDVLLGHILARLGGLRHPARVVVATTSAATDDPIASFCASRGVDCFRGSEPDVLDRYCRCAQQFGLDPVVRLTADNPFPDIEELDKLIALHQESGADYSHSFSTLPVGVGSEVFTRAALERAREEGRAAHHREHVNEYVLENPRLFNIRELRVSGPKARPDLRLTVDTEEDYARICAIAAGARADPVTTEEAIRLCTRSV